MRAFTALALALAVFLTSLGLKVSAATWSTTPSGDNDYFLLYQGDNGDAVCREANALERRDLEKIVPKNLRQINHTSENALRAESTTVENDVSHLTIILRATANLDAAPDAKAAFTRAAAAWENVVTSPVTIYIDADYGPDNFGSAWASGVLGATSSPSSIFGYGLVRSNLVQGANTPTKSAIYNALPASSVPIDNGSGSATSVSVSASVARAIGLLNATAQSTDTAARIGFNSGVSFDFDHSDGVDFGKIDFEAVATHEIGHALGFTSRSGGSTSTPAMWDLYRFRSGTTTDTFTTAQRIMTLGGPTANSQYYFVPGSSELGLSDGGPSGSSTNNADGNQSSHWRQQSLNTGNVLIGIMDPRIPPRTRRDIMPNDVNALNVFGYNSNAVAPPSPPANDNFTNAQTITGCSGTVTGTNVAATQESGEPNHSPDNNGGTHSIWYQWQAPASGNVTFTTAGSGFDTVLAVYTGNAVNSLSSIVKNDDVDLGMVTTSTVTFPATAGVFYRIAVDGYNNSSSNNGEIGPVTLNWNLDNCANVWLPTVLSAGQVDLKSWTISGRTSMYAKLTFPDAGYRVANWGTPTQSGNAFTDDATIEKFNGVSAQAISSTAQIWDLGVLAAGDYTFTFKNSGTTVKTLSFTVSATAPPPNPIDDPREFVRWQYKDFLRREPDLPGWDHWTAEITMCSDPANRRPGETEAQCVDRKRENTSAAFFVSPEFQNTGYFVLRVYRGSLGRMPHFGGTGSPNDEFTRDAAIVGQGIVVNDALAPDVINANKQAFVNGFVTRSEFRAIYDGLNNTQYVDKLFQTTGVTPTAAERQALIDGLNASTLTRAGVLFRVVDGTQTTTGGLLIFQTNYGKAFYDNLFNQAFVQMEYFGYLLRDPDPDGYAFWLGKLNTFGDWVNAEMVKAFINSPEYRARFGAP
ncbi:MAG TPA: NF038122 family metalloprotease [Pyrinomonadaceae bacterium]